MPGANPPRVPEGLRDMMKGLTKEVLREKPPNIYEFSAYYFESLLPEKKGFDFQGYEPIASYETIFKNESAHVNNNQVPLALVYAIVPEQLTELIKEFIKAVLRANPKNICEFAVGYFRKLQELQYHKTHNIQYKAYENYLKGTQSTTFTSYLRCTCGRLLGEGVERTSYETQNVKRHETRTTKGGASHITLKSSPQFKNDLEVTRESTIKKSVQSTKQISVTNKNINDSKKAISIYDNERCINALIIIQRFFRNSLIKREQRRGSIRTEKLSIDKDNDLPSSQLTKLAKEEAHAQSSIDTVSSELSSEAKQSKETESEVQNIADAGKIKNAHTSELQTSLEGDSLVERSAINNEESDVPKTAIENLPFDEHRIRKIDSSAEPPKRTIKEKNENYIILESNDVTQQQQTQSENSITENSAHISQIGSTNENSLYSSDVNALKDDLATKQQKTSTEEATSIHLNVEEQNKSTHKIASETNLLSSSAIQDITDFPSNAEKKVSEELHPSQDPSATIVFNDAPISAQDRTLITTKDETSNINLPNEMEKSSSSFKLVDSSGTHDITASDEKDSTIKPLDGYTFPEPLRTNIDGQKKDDIDSTDNKTKDALNGEAASALLDSDSVSAQDVPSIIVKEKLSTTVPSNGVIKSEHIVPSSVDSSGSGESTTSDQNDSISAAKPQTAKPSLKNQSVIEMNEQNAFSDPNAEEKDQLNDKVGPNEKVGASIGNSEDFTNIAKNISSSTEIPEEDIISKRENSSFNLVHSLNSGKTPDKNLEDPTTKLNYNLATVEPFQKPIDTQDKRGVDSKDFDEKDPSNSKIIPTLISNDSIVAPDESSITAKDESLSTQSTMEIMRTKQEGTPFSSVDSTGPDKIPPGYQEHFTKIPKSQSVNAEKHQETVLENPPASTKDGSSDIARNISSSTEFLEEDIRNVRDDLSHNLVLSPKSNKTPDSSQKDSTTKFKYNSATDDSSKIKISTEENLAVDSKDFDQKDLSNGKIVSTLMDNDSVIALDESSIIAKDKSLNTDSPVQIVSREKEGSSFNTLDFSGSDKTPPSDQEHFFHNPESQSANVEIHRATVSMKDKKTANGTDSENKDELNDKVGSMQTVDTPTSAQDNSAIAPENIFSSPENFVEGKRIKRDDSSVNLVHSPKSDKTLHSSQEDIIAKLKCIPATIEQSKMAIDTQENSAVGSTGFDDKDPSNGKFVSTLIDNNSTITLDEFSTVAKEKSLSRESVKEIVTKEQESSPLNSADSTVLDKIPLSDQEHLTSKLGNQSTSVEVSRETALVGDKVIADGTAPELKDQLNNKVDSIQKDIAPISTQDGSSNIAKNTSSSTEFLEEDIRNQSDDSSINVVLSPKCDKMAYINQEDLITKLKYNPTTVETSKKTTDTQENYAVDSKDFDEKDPSNGKIDSTLIDNNSTITLDEFSTIAKDKSLSSESVKEIVRKEQESPPFNSADSAVSNKIPLSDQEHLTSKFGNQSTSVEVPRETVLVREEVIADEAASERKDQLHNKVGSTQEENAPNSIQDGSSNIAKSISSSIEIPEEDIKSKRDDSSINLVHSVNSDKTPDKNQEGPTTKLNYNLATVEPSQKPSDTQSKCAIDSKDSDKIVPSNGKIDSTLMDNDSIIAPNESSIIAKDKSLNTYSPMHIVGTFSSVDSSGSDKIPPSNQEHFTYNPERQSTNGEIHPETVLMKDKKTANGTDPEEKGELNDKVGSMQTVDTPTSTQDNSSIGAENILSSPESLVEGIRIKRDDSSNNLVHSLKSDKIPYNNQEGLITKLKLNSATTEPSKIIIDIQEKYAKEGKHFDEKDSSIDIVASTLIDNASVITSDESSIIVGDKSHGTESPKEIVRKEQEGSPFNSVDSSGSSKIPPSNQEHLTGKSGNQSASVEIPRETPLVRDKVSIDGTDSEGKIEKDQLNDKYYSMQIVDDAISNQGDSSIILSEKSLNDNLFREVSSEDSIIKPDVISKNIETSQTTIDGTDAGREEDPTIKLENESTNIKLSPSTIDNQHKDAIDDIESVVTAPMKDDSINIQGDLSLIAKDIPSNVEQPSQIEEIAQNDSSLNLIDSSSSDKVTGNDQKDFTIISKIEPTNVESLQESIHAMQEDTINETHSKNNDPLNDNNTTILMDDSSISAENNSPTSTENLETKNRNMFISSTIPTGSEEIPNNVKENTLTLAPVANATLGTSDNSKQSNPEMAPQNISLDGKEGSTVTAENETSSKESFDKETKEATSITGPLLEGLANQMKYTNLDEQDVGNKSFDQAAISDRKSTTTTAKDSDIESHLKSDEEVETHTKHTSGIISSTSDSNLASDTDQKGFACPDGTKLQNPEQPVISKTDTSNVDTTGGTDLNKIPPITAEESGIIPKVNSRNDEAIKPFHEDEREEDEVEKKTSIVGEQQENATVTSNNKVLNNKLSDVPAEKTEEMSEKSGLSPDTKQDASTSNESTVFESNVHNEQLQKEQSLSSLQTISEKMQLEESAKPDNFESDYAQKDPTLDMSTDQAHSKSGTHMTDTLVNNDAVDNGKLTSQLKIGTQNSRKDSNIIDSSQKIESVLHSSVRDSKENIKVKEHFIGRPMDARIAELHLKSFRNTSNVPWYVYTSPVEDTSNTNAGEPLTAEHETISSENDETDFSDSLNENNFEKDSLELTTSKETDIDDDSLETVTPEEESISQSTKAVNENERTATYLYGVHVPRQTPPQTRRIYKKPTAFTINIDTHSDENLNNTVPKHLTTEAVDFGAGMNVDETKRKTSNNDFESGNETESPLEMESPTRIFAELSAIDPYDASSNEQTNSYSLNATYTMDEIENVVPEILYQGEIDIGDSVIDTVQNQSDEKESHKVLESVLDPIIELNEESNEPLAPYEAESEYENDFSSSWTASKENDEYILSDEIMNYKEKPDEFVKTYRKRSIVDEADTQNVGGIYEFDQRHTPEVKSEDGYNTSNESANGDLIEDDIAESVLLEEHSSNNDERKIRQENLKSGKINDIVESKITKSAAPEEYKLEEIPTKRVNEITKLSDVERITEDASIKTLNEDSMDNKTNDDNNEMLFENSKDMKTDGNEPLKNVSQKESFDMQKCEEDLDKSLMLRDVQEEVPHQPIDQSMLQSKTKFQGNIVETPSIQEKVHIQHGQFKKSPKAHSNSQDNDTISNGEAVTHITTDASDAFSNQLVTLTRAATLIQKFYRKYREQKQLKTTNNNGPQTCLPENNFTDLTEKKPFDANINEQQNLASTKIQQSAAIVIQNAYRKYLESKSRNVERKTSVVSSADSSQITQIYIDDDVNSGTKCISLGSDETNIDLPNDSIGFLSESSNSPKSATLIAPAFDDANDNKSKVNWFVGTELIETTNPLDEENVSDLLGSADSHAGDINLITTENMNNDDSNRTSTTPLISSSSNSIESKLINSTNNLLKSGVIPNKFSAREINDDKDGYDDGKVDSASDSSTPLHDATADAKESDKSGTEINTTAGRETDNKLQQGDAISSEIEDNPVADSLFSAVETITIMSKFLNAEKLQYYSENNRIEDIELKKQQPRDKSNASDEHLAMSEIFIEAEKCHNETNIPYEQLEQTCLKKSVSLTYLADDTNSFESVIQSSSPECDNGTALEMMTDKLAKADETVKQMQKRASVSSLDTKMREKKELSFEEPIIHTMKELQSTPPLSAEDEKVILNQLQHEDTRESSAQSDAVVFGSVSYGDEEEENGLHEFSSAKTAIKRHNTIASGDSKVLHKTVTIDDTIKYYELDNSAGETMSGNSLYLDDDISANIREKMMAYSLSEADDSDPIDSEAMAEKRKQDNIDFNISTALADNTTGTSTETESTIVSAGVAPKTRTKDNTDNTIDESLEKIIEAEAAKKIQSTYRSYYRRKELQRAETAARRMTLQRGDALQNDSTPDEEKSDASTECGQQTADLAVKKITTAAVSKTTATADGRTERAKIIVNNKLKWLAMRQNSMPVQIDSEVFRVIPKHMRKRIKSAEGDRKPRRRILKD